MMRKKRNGHGDEIKGWEANVCAFILCEMVYNCLWEWWIQFLHSSCSVPCISPYTHEGSTFSNQLHWGLSFAETNLINSSMRGKLSCRSLHFMRAYHIVVNRIFISLQFIRLFFSLFIISPTSFHAIIKAASICQNFVALSHSWLVRRLSRETTHFKLSQCEFRCCRPTIYDHRLEMKRRDRERDEENHCVRWICRLELRMNYIHNMRDESVTIILHCVKLKRKIMFLRKSQSLEISRQSKTSTSSQPLINQICACGNGSRLESPTKTIWLP